MKPRPHLLAALALLGCFGCSTPQALKTVQLDEIPAGRIAELDAMPEVEAQALPTRAYADLGQVEGISCKRSSKETASWEDATRRAKYRALQKGADAIANLQCEEPKSSSFLGRLTSAVAPTCMESIRCTASAVKR